ncbi:UNVERIFIED_CONTAM: hypothetical protein Sradi_3979400 [Sesamum radiatum]|uniref:Integrase catalytic domain-containing protein n=1 Tax=Sesamum radiatum TaxID=300843 RepID=A0AAW2PGQ8_SESRA
MGSCQAQDTSRSFHNARTYPLQEVLYAPSAQMLVYRGRDSHSTGNTQWMLWSPRRHTDLGQQSPPGRIFLAHHETRCNPISEQVREMPKTFFSHISANRTPHYNVVPLSLHTVGDGHCRPFPWPRVRESSSWEIISDKGHQFQGRRIQEWCQGLHIKHRLTTVAHPQANGQVKVTNRILIQGIKRRLERVGGNWMEELTSVLWVYRTTPRGSTGETPFSLVYGTKAIIPAELGIPSHRVMNFSEECNENLLRENLDLIEELKEKAFLHVQRYKNIMISSYNRRVKSRSFQVGDLVLRRADALKPIGKLDPTWEGPYKVTRVIGKGAYELEDPEGRPLPRPWNVHNLKKYLA